MASHTLDDLARPRLDWPEPLLIELIEASYGRPAEDGETIVAARLQARFLRALIDGETDRSGPLRVKLIACCTARNITADAIAAADHAVFQELNEIIQSRFRNSPRLRLHFVRQLRDAVGALTRRDSPAKKVDKVRALLLRARAPREPALAFTG